VRVDPEFAELYRSQFAAVFRTAWAALGNREAAEDATQEAFARALERWKRLRGRAWAGGWVTRTALNAGRRMMRRRREPPTDESVAPDVELAADVWRAVRSLPRRQQEAVVLRYVADLPVAEVAEAMGCAEGTVKAHLARARERLRLELDEVRDEG
jgi:RNA polymerase sigma-70 factor (ECF subfamily)